MQGFWAISWGRYFLTRKFFGGTGVVIKTCDFERFGGLRVVPFDSSLNSTHVYNVERFGDGLGHE